MVRGLIEGLLGDFGTSILNFYEANSLWINGIILLYGIVIVLSWSNYKSIRRSLVFSTVEQLRQKSEAELREAPARLLGSVVIPWDETMKRTWFPLVADQTAFLPRRLNLERLQKILSPEDLVKDAVRVLTGAKSAKAAK